MSKRPGHDLSSGWTSSVWQADAVSAAVIIAKYKQYRFIELPNEKYKTPPISLPLWNSDFKFLKRLTESRSVFVASVTTWTHGMGIVAYSELWRYPCKKGKKTLNGDSVFGGIGGKAADTFCIELAYALGAHASLSIDQSHVYLVKPISPKFHAFLIVQ